MPLYYFHLRDGVDHIIDPDGIELPAEKLKSVALRQARDCMAGDVKKGRLDLSCRIEVHDAKETIVYTLAFGDAVTITPAPSPEK